MKYNFICKKMDLSDNRKEMLLKKISRSEKFFDDDTECKIVISQLKKFITIELTILYKGFLLRAEADALDLMDAADECIAKLDRQIRKNKTKLAKRIKESGFENYEPMSAEADEIHEEKEEFQIIKHKHFSSKPMSAEEAVLQMNMLGHSFFIFTNPETMDTNIVYRRKDGNYGLIETD